MECVTRTGFCDGLVSDVGDIINFFLTVENGGCFLESLAFCFDEEEVYVADLESEESAVYDVL